MVDWAWDEEKNRTNLSKHGIDFGLAKLVFDDPLAASREDMSYSGEDRWQTVGMIGPIAVFVVHTSPEGRKPGRIISARKATRHERKAYEEDEF